MKRLFILSAAVAALASCSNSEAITEVNEPQVPDKAIAFETFSSNATRAENSQENNKEGLENHHSNFSVWGYKDVSTTAVFDRQTVNYNSASGKWEYSPIRFWDKGANKYEFYACAPKDENASNSVFTLKPTSTNTSYKEAYYFIAETVTLQAETLDKNTYSEEYKTSTSGLTLQNTDYMIASKCECDNVATAASSSVQLNFNHILSRLNITVQKAQKQDGNAFKNATVSLTELKVCNMKSTGSFDESKELGTGSVLANGTTERWSTQNSPLINYVANSLSNVTTNSQYVLQSLVIPQKVEYEEINRDGTTGTAENKVALDNTNQPYIELAYTIESTANGTTHEESFKTYFNLAKVFGESSTNGTVSFNEGWQNTLHITIDADVISFTADVYKWDDNKTYELNSDTGASSQTSTSGGN